MESKVSPDSIQERADKLAAAPEPEVKPEIKAEVVPEAKVEVKAEVKPVEQSIKSDTSKKAEAPVEKPIPNDPAELRKWNTKVSQENAAMREEVRALKASIDRMMKKPIDYKELAKNPEALQKQIDQEKAEAIAEMQDKLQEATTRAVAKETEVERIRCEHDTENFPEWKRVFPLIQNLAANTDGRINFNKPPKEVLKDLYDLATQLAPAKIVEETPTPPAPQTPPAPVAKTYTEADLEAARKEAFDKAQEALRNEQNGAGVGSLGKGGKRSSGVSKEALQEMPLSDLKRLISKE